MRQIAGYCFLYLIFLMIFTLNPFTFSTAPFREFLLMDPASRIEYLFLFKIYDVISNVILFIPFGLCLKSAFTLRKPNRSAGLWLPALLGFLLSLMIETAQLFLIRSTSVIDLLSNTCGAFLGFYFSGQVVLMIRWIRKRASIFFRAAVTGLAMAAICYIFLLPIRMSNFSNWNPDYPLAFYNEASGDRPWEGEIRYCIFLNHALDADAIREIHSSDSWDMEGISSATFGISLSVPPNTGVKPPHTGRLGQIIAPPLMETSQMTLLLRIRTNRPDQSGPARIVTQSMDPNRRNWTLGQTGKRLVLRVRTPISGRNGSRFQLITPECIPDTSWHDVAATYRRGVARIYVDGEPVPSNMNLSRDYLPVIFGMGSHVVAWFAFCFVLFIPFFFLFYCQAGKLRIPIAFAGLILFALGIEFILLVTTGQAISGAVSFSAAIIGIIASGFSSILKNPEKREEKTTLSDRQILIQKLRNVLSFTQKRG